MAVQNKLSGSELKVMRLLDKGLSNKAIAVQLGVSGNTVKFHLKNIYKKLNVHNRLEAVRKSSFHL
jgi:DNA-binding NarL/FixJ family response regulator